MRRLARQSAGPARTGAYSRHNPAPRLPLAPTCLGSKPGPGREGPCAGRLATIPEDNEGVAPKRSGGNTPPPRREGRRTRRGRCWTTESPSKAVVRTMQPAAPPARAPLRRHGAPTRGVVSYQALRAHSKAKSDRHSRFGLRAARGRPRSPSKNPPPGADSPMNAKRESMLPFSPTGSRTLEAARQQTSQRTTGGPHKRHTWKQHTCTTRS